MRLVRAGIWLLLILVGIIGAMVLLSHTAHAEAACLLYDTRDEQGGEARTIDRTAGRRFVYRRAPAQLLPFPMRQSLI